FSEACEVCAGRGVVVHHDPVVKHRSSSNNSGQSNNRRQRGGNNNQQNQNSQAPSPVAHSIPEGAKTALAQIAASTLAPVAEAPVIVPVVEREEPVASERPKKPRKKRSSDRTKAPKTEAEQLLDSVLDALPEPKAPGQGRNRRRVTTAALTGTPISVNSSATSVASGDSES